MKTLTEFTSITLKNATQTKQDLLAAGKTAEELPAAMGEALKLEGDKLTYLLNAIEAVGTKANDLKRVVVFTLGENEKAPAGAQQVGEQYYAAEYYPPIAKRGAAGAPAGEERGKRGDKKGGKRGGHGKRGGREGGGGEREGRRGGGRGERPEARAAAGEGTQPQAKAPRGPIALPKPRNPKPAAEPAASAESKPE